MIKVLIVEDEMPSARKLKSYIENLTEDFEILAILDSVSETVSFLQENKVDLIFLDIHLSDGNSFKIFDEVIVETPIIFTTAYDQYAIRAFEQVSVDYLLKPLEKEKLAKSIDKFRNVYAHVDENKDVFDYKKLNDKVLETLHSQDYKSRFLVHYRDKLKVVSVDQISAIYYDNRTVFIMTFKNESYEFQTTMESIENELDPKYFFRANRKSIVNIKAVEDAVLYSKNKLKLNLSTKLPFDIIVSSEKTPKLKQWLNQ